MPSMGDLEQALAELGTDQWFRPALGVVDTSSQLRFFDEPFDTYTKQTFANGPFVWREDLDVTSELSFCGVTPLAWLTPVKATHAEIVNVSLLYRDTVYLTLSGFAIQEGFTEDHWFDVDQNFWVIPIPDHEGKILKDDCSILWRAVSQMAEVDPLDETDLAQLLGLRVVDAPRR